MMPTPLRSLTGKWLAFAFLLLAAGIGALWYSALSAYEAAVLRERGRELQAIAELKIEFIRSWLAERRGDAAIPGSAPLMVRAAEFGVERGDPGGSNAVSARLDAFRKAHGYESVMLFGRDGKLHAAAGPTDETVRRLAWKAAREATLSGKAVVSPAYHSTAGGHSHLDIDIAAPVVSEGKPPSGAVGALVFHLDPRTQLDPLLRKWPASNESGETLFVERNGEEVVYLGALRGDAARLRRPVAETLLPATMATRGRQGVVEGLDYRGVPVLAAVGQVPDMPWFVVAKIDRAEILAPVRREALWSGALAALLALALGLAMLSWWRRGRSELALAQEAAAKDALAVSEARYRFVFEGSPLPMWIFDLDTLAFLEVNDAATAQYGYSREEFLAMSVRDIRPPGQVAALEEALRQPAPDPTGRRWTHRRKDGSLIEAVVWRQDMDYAGRPARMVLAEDVSERVRAESVLRTFLDAAPGVSAVMRPNGVLLAANEATAGALGQAPDALVGRNLFDLLPREIALRRRHWLARVASEKRPMRFEENTNGRWFEHHAAPVVDAGGEVSSVAWVAIEVTEQKLAERQRLRLARRQRDALVREVHHRIKNHLQGLVGLLRQHVGRHPELGPPIDTAVAQINAISVVHGLQGRTEQGQPSLRGLVAEIAAFLGGVMGIALTLEERERQCFQARPCAAEGACKWVLAEEESVPVALIINELLTNAVRHRRGAAPPSLDLRCDRQGACLTLRNAGRLDAGLDFDNDKGLGTGLGLVRSLMPPRGVTIGLTNPEEGRVETRVMLTAPILLRTAEAADQVASRR